MIQIIAGKHRGRKLETPQGRDIRPTGARVREAVFNILTHLPHSSGPMLMDAEVADICCGSGAMGMEALSRGAAHCYFIDQSREALALVKATVERFREDAHCTLLRQEATRLPPAPKPCRLVFIDPPYHKNLLPPILAAALAKNWLALEGLIVTEMSHKEAFECPPELEIRLDRIYGHTRVVFLALR